MFRQARIAVSGQLADEDQLEFDRLVDSHYMERSGIRDAQLLSDAAPKADVAEARQSMRYGPGIRG